MPADADVTSDEMLLLGARLRDETALGMLYDRYGGLVYALALRIVGDRDLAEEVAHDVLIRCWHDSEQYDRSRGTLPGWLLGMARQRGGQGGDPDAARAGAVGRDHAGTGAGPGEPDGRAAARLDALSE